MIVLAWVSAAITLWDEDAGTVAAVLATIVAVVGVEAVVHRFALRLGWLQSLISSMAANGVGAMAFVLLVLLPVVGPVLALGAKVLVVAALNRDYPDRRRLYTVGAAATAVTLCTSAAVSWLLLSSSL